MRGLICAILWAGMVSLCLLGGCGKQNHSNEVVDRGTQRIAVLSPALAIILRDLGRSDRIVARHGWDMASEATLPIVGDQRGVDYEVLLSVEPDVVLMESGAEEVPARLAQLAESNGWEVVRLPMLTLGDVRDAIGRVDRLTNDGAVSGRGEELLESFDGAMRRRAGLGERAGRVVMLVSAGPPGVLGPGSFHYEIGVSMGLEMVPRDGAAFINMSAEALRGLEPDVIVMIVPAAGADALEALIGPLRSLGMRAVEEGRVVVMSGEESLTPSSAMIGFADELARRLESLAGGGG